MANCSSRLMTPQTCFHFDGNRIWHQHGCCSTLTLLTLIPAQNIGLCCFSKKQLIFFGHLVAGKQTTHTALTYYILLLCCGESVSKYVPIYTSGGHIVTLAFTWDRVSVHLMNVIFNLLLAVFWSPLIPEENICLFSC